MLLLDNSAWARLSSPDLDDDRREEVATTMEQGDYAVCLPFLLEAGYSARSAADHAAILTALATLPQIHLSVEIEANARDAQATLARQGHHRVAPSDLVIAACADAAGAGVLHYDRDFDIIAERTDLDFESTWLAPAGTLP